MNETKFATTDLSRRGFIKASAAATGGLVIGVSFPVLDVLGQEQPVKEAGRLNGFVQIDPDNTVTITLTHAEMGQGIHTALPMIVAEELEADWTKIRVVKAPAMTTGGMAEADLGTGGSRSVRSKFEILSQAGATAREMLRQAAANRWAIPLEDTVARNGAVFHPDGRSATYGELVRGASLLPMPAVPPLKEKSQRRLVGRPMNRLDSHEKVTAQATYGIDVRLPGMLVGTVRHCPVWGGALRFVDHEPALAVRGVHKVIETDNSVIVVGDGYWPARKGLLALSPEWEPGKGASVSSEGITAKMAKALRQKGAMAVERGRVDQALKHVSNTVMAAYEVPFLHQATMEPMNATAWVHDGKIEVWAPIQSGGRVRHSIAEEFDVDIADVNVHVTYLGGGFGRRIGMSFVRPAIIASREAGVPVQVIWSREEDMAQPMMRPCAAASFTAGINQVGLPVVWDNKLVVPSVSQQLAPQRVQGGVDQISVHGAEHLQYSMPHQRLDYSMPEAGAPLGFWRAVPHTYNAFFVESFMDEIAAATKQDPVDLRRALMQEHPRNLAVLERLAAVSDWSVPPPEGHHRGVAIHESFGSICGQVVEISVPADKTLKLERITAVVDCGTAINPRTIEAQIEGSIAYALTAAVYGRIDIAGGATVQHNFDTYEMLKLSQMPPVSVFIMENGPIGGIGEPGVPPLAPALANAIFAATGERVRKLPLMEAGFSLL